MESGELKVENEKLNFKAGFVSIIGKPNVGKSTLMNRLIGEKLSIVSPKPQTTRMSIRGFYNTDQVQIIFLDTPGFLEPRYELQEKMRNYITESLKNSDVILFLTDINDFPTDYDIKVIELLKKYKGNVVWGLNKADLSEFGIRNAECGITPPPSEIPHPTKGGGNSTLSTLHFPFDEAFPLSALKQYNFDELLNKIIEYLPYSPPLYNQDDLSDMPMRFFAQEIIREKIFLNYGQEIPYCTTVVVEKWIEEESRDVIRANIWIERDTQKNIIIGRNGAKIGKVRQGAEADIMKLTGRKVVLNLWVKVKHDWRKKNGALSEFGYH